MGKRNVGRDVEKAARALARPLASVEVLLAFKSALEHMDGAVGLASEKGVASPEARREGLEALRQMLIAFHEFSGVLLEEFQTTPGSELSVVNVEKVKTPRRTPSQKRRREPQPPP